jgi:hypothetical protein
MELAYMPAALFACDYVLVGVRFKKTRLGLIAVQANTGIK